MLYRGIYLLLYNFCLFAAAGSSNGSDVTSKSGSPVGSLIVGRSNGSGVTKSSGSPVGSLVRNDSSPDDMTMVVHSPDSPPQHTILNLAGVGRVQSATSIASQLSERYKKQLDHIILSNPEDRALLMEGFDRDVGTHSAKVPSTDIVAVLTSSAGVAHTSSDEDTDGSGSGSSSKSDPRYVKKLEELIEGQDRQLCLITRVDLHARLAKEEERKQHELEKQCWQEEQQRLEADRNSQRRDKNINIGLAVLSLITGGILGLYPLIDKAVNGCG